MVGNMQCVSISTAYISKISVLDDARSRTKISVLIQNIFHSTIVIVTGQSVSFQLRVSLGMSLASACSGSTAHKNGGRSEYRNNFRKVKSVFKTIADGAF